MHKLEGRSKSGRIRLLTSRGFQVFFAILFLATAVTWITGLMDSHYEPLGVPNYGDIFPQNIENWNLLGDSNLLKSGSGRFQISPNTEHHTRAEYILDLPEYISRRDDLVRVRSVINTVKRPSSSSLKNDAGLLIRLIDHNEEITLWGWVSQLSGEFDVHQDEKLVEIGPSTQSIKLVFTNRDSDGIFEVERVWLEIVRVSEVYKLVIFPALVTLWLTTGYIAGSYLFKKLGRVRALIFAGALSALVIGVLLPASLREVFVAPVFNRLQSIGLAGENIALMHYYKIGHFVTFFVISLVLFLNRRRLRLSRTDICAVMFMIAIATEAAQLHLFFRSTQIMDVLIDMSGVVLALLLYRILIKFDIKRKTALRNSQRVSR